MEKKELPDASSRDDIFLKFKTVFRDPKDRASAVIPITIMRQELKIDLLEANVDSMIGDTSSRPEGLTLRGPYGTSLNSLDAPQIAAFILVVISMAQGAMVEAAREVAKEEIKKWLTEFLERHKAKRIRINGQKAETPGDIERIIRDEIDIGKND